MCTLELKKMTRDLCHELYKNWENDPSIYGDMSAFSPYVYRTEIVDKYFDAKNIPSRVLFVHIEHPFTE